MKKCFCVVFVLVFGHAFSAASDTMEVHCTVADINELSVDVINIPIIDIISIPSGQLFASETDTSSKYMYTTNNADKKITAVMDQDMPFLTTLEIELDASAGKGVSTGTQLLSTSSVDVVNSINQGFQDVGQQITYTFTVTLGADPFASLSRAVTLSLVDE